MPTYVYACKSCDDRLEVVQKMSDPALVECAKCGGGLRRLLFPPAVVYKGSGFYTTDYKNGGRKSESAAGAESKDSSSTSETKPEKTDAKPEAKSETKTEPAAAK